MNTLCLMNFIGMGMTTKYHLSDCSRDEKTGRAYRGTSLIRNSPPPQGHHKALARNRPAVGSQEGGLSYERGTLALHLSRAKGDCGAVASWEEERERAKDRGD